MKVYDKNGEILSGNHETFVMPSDGYTIVQEDHVIFCSAVITAEQKIAQIQEYLRSTDYIGARIAEGSKTVDEYQALIDKRESKRERLRELENAAKIIEQSVIGQKTTTFSVAAY